MSTSQHPTPAVLEAALAALTADSIAGPAGEVLPLPSRHPRRRRTPRTRAVQLSLPLEWTLPSGTPARPYLVAAEPEEAMRAPADLPNPAQWAAHMARALVETSFGERPSAQLMRWVSHEALTALHHRGAAARRHPSHGATSRLRQVRGVRTCAVAPGIVEASAVVVGPQRAHAVAMRLEARGTRWVVTEVQIG